MQMVKSETDYTQQLCDTCTQEFMEDFKAWWVLASPEIAIITGCCCLIFVRACADIFANQVSVALPVSLQNAK